MEISEDISGSNDQIIIKGKRTKRLRSSSSTSSSGVGYGSSGGYSGGGGGGGSGDFNYNLVSSPATSTSTEEDEDMANCLILLARGGFSSQTGQEIKPSESKFRSRKFTEMATTTNGKVGIYVYECKTCSRTFPSFQALGGHRASHKKPKPAGDVDQKVSLPPPAAALQPPEDQPGEEEEEEDVKFSKINNTVISTAPSPNKICHKSHECSICGAEFASGQALGGHMRRHRSANNTITTATITKGGTDSSSSTQDSGEKTRNLLSLDLNLPAPPEDESRETKFHQFSPNQQAHLVFSAAAPLVDCHY